ncbi:MAG TPA: ChaN family lipoprotein [Terriglobales bacterium]|nr:ChaN family lipoprotein [Terriglobales bacterium]
MATTGILRSRRSVAQLHALAGVEREIRANDNSSMRKYVRDFRDAYRSYDRVLTCDGVRRRIAESGIVLVGDYHALPTSQRYLASLLRDAGLRGRPIALGVETIFARDQHIVDEWQRGEIDECELRQRIRFDLDWGYDWAPFFDVLSAAQEQGAPIYGLDCMPREDLRKIGARDRHAADKIVEMRGAHPDALIFVLFGESHLAPQHLPCCLEERLEESGLKADARARRVLTVLQNVDALYWRAAGEDRDCVEAVEVSPDVLCVFNATPLEKYENYRLCLDRWGRGDDSGPDLGPTIYNLIDGLVRFLDINQYSPHNSTQPRLLVDLMPEVYSRNSDALLRRLLSRKGFSAAQKRAMLHQVGERGGAYLAPLNAFYVRKFEMTSATEDAARFLHHACRGLPDRVNGKHHELRGLQDAFFGAVLEHALACLGSRVLHPARAPFRDAELEELHDLTCEDLERQTGLNYPDVVDVIEFLSWYRHSARAARHASADWTRALVFSGRKWQFTTERLGALLGNDLYDAYLEGRLGPPALRRLYLAHLEQPGEASEVYANLQVRLR